MIKYTYNPSNIKLNITKNLLSKLYIDYYIYELYISFSFFLTRNHCDIKLFEATKFFLFRLYQAGYYSDKFHNRDYFVHFDYYQCDKKDKNIFYNYL